MPRLVYGELLSCLFGQLLDISFPNVSIRSRTTAKPPTPQRASGVSRIQIDATLKVNGRDSISIVVLVKHKYQKSIKQILMELMCLI